MSHPLALDQTRFDNAVLLGSGATSRVYRADDTLLGFPVAVKVLEDTDSGPLFRREFSLIAGLDHPGVTRVYDYIRQASVHAIVMDLHEGPSLDVFEGTQDWDDETWKSFAEQLIQAIAHLHKNNVLHCDIKPANICISADGNPVLVDLGHAVRPGIRLPWVGITPAFAPPECMLDDAPTFAWDAWALGVTLHWLAVGSLPMSQARLQHPLGELIEGLLKRDPAMRLSIQTLAQRSLSGRHLGSTSTTSESQSYPTSVSADPHPSIHILATRNPVESTHNLLQSLRAQTQQPVHVLCPPGRLMPYEGLEEHAEYAASRCTPGDQSALARFFPSVAVRTRHTGTPDRIDCVQALGRGLHALSPVVIQGADALGSMSGILLGDALVSSYQAGLSPALFLIGTSTDTPFLRALRDAIAATPLVVERHKDSGHDLTSSPPSLNNSPAGVDTLLSVLSICPSPIPLGTLVKVARLSQSHLPDALGFLRSRGFVEWSVGGDSLSVSLHPNISLPTTDLPEALGDTHSALAEHLVAPAQRAHHLHAAGRSDDAEQVLTTAVAAAEHQPDTVRALLLQLEQVRPLTENELTRLADAHYATRRAREAAVRYLALAEDTTGASRRSLRRRAAGLLLAAAFESEGLPVMESLLSEVSGWLPKRFLWQIIRLIWSHHSGDHKLRVQFDAPTMPPSEAEQLQTLFDAAVGVSMWHPFRSATLQAELLHRSLKHAPSVHLVQALAVHLVQTSGWSYDIAKCNQISNVIQDVSAHVGTSEAQQFAQLAAAGAAWMNARPAEIQVHVENAAASLTATGNPHPWLRSTVGILETVALARTGQFSELRQSVPRHLAEATSRQDRYSSCQVRIHGGVWVDLCEDHIEAACSNIDFALVPWRTLGVTILTFFALLRHIDIDLYADEAVQAWDRLARARRQLSMKPMFSLDAHRMLADVAQARICVALVQSGHPMANRRAQAALRQLVKWDAQWVRAHRYALLAATTKDAAQAAQHASNARDAFESLGSSAEAWAVTRRYLSGVREYPGVRNSTRMAQLLIGASS
jgi:serine/threonine protein kinase